MKTQTILQNIVVVLAVLMPGFSRAHASDTIFLEPGGSLNGQTIDASHYWITVNPGDPISGTIKVQTFNGQPPSAIEPLGYTVTWGDRVAQVVTTNAWIETGTNYYDIPVSKTAPMAPGTYYIVMAHSGTYNMQQIMSATHPAWEAFWNDGNDFGWDWTQAEYGEARSQGHVTQLWGMPDVRVSSNTSTAGANWVGVKVEPDDSDTDTDGDGVPDSIDGCPQDPNKTQPGNCGCGKPETANCGGNTQDRCLLNLCGTCILSGGLVSFASMFCMKMRSRRDYGASWRRRHST